MTIDEALHKLHATLVTKIHAARARRDEDEEYVLASRLGHVSRLVGLRKTTADREEDQARRRGWWQ